jgi:D-glycero-alpha-D-manno-heptose-7-phosphate kinase
MIITRTPFRISFSGGGSDLEAFYQDERGLVLSTAINRYMFLAVKSHFARTFRVSYSRTELVDTVAEIEHPIVRECLRALDISQGLEIVSMGDLPAQSGMGSSSSFTVGLLHALHAFQARAVSPELLAQQACHIEIERLGEPIGKQDQYIAAYGGLQVIQFQPDGSVLVDPVVCSARTRQELNRHLLMFFTGATRESKQVLSRQRANTGSRRPILRELCRIAERLRDVLTHGTNLNAFGYLLHDAWQVKKDVESSITNPLIDEYYLRGCEAGALGGKLLGAGGGGFLLFFCEPDRHDAVRRELKELQEAPFLLEPQGSKIVHFD